MYKENNPNFWYLIVSLFFSFLIILATGITAWINRKDYKAMKPVITECNFKSEIDGICIFKLTIVNQKPHNVTLKKMMMKKKSLFSKYIPVFWIPPIKRKEARSNSLHDMVAARLSSKTITFIKDQETLDITVKINLDPQATYRLLVKTSVGNCQYDLTNLDLFAIAKNQS